MADTGAVLVTGGAGYIGSHAVLALREAGYRVVVIDDLSTGFRWAIPAEVPLVEGDAGDMTLVSRTIDQHRCGAVMHFAGSIIVPESVANPLKYYRNNTANSRNLIEAAVTSGVRHIIFSSTATVYGAPEHPGLKETDPTEPINPYAMSKLMTERMLADAAAAYDFNYAVLRYFNVAGADPHGRTGQSTPTATHLIKVACQAVTGQRDHVSVYGTDYPTADGTGVRDYIHVSDLASAHVAALVALTAKPRDCLTLNVGYGRGASVLEVLDAVDRVAGVKLDRRIEPRRAGDTAILVAAVDAVHAALDWKPLRDNLDTIIADALAWERSLDLRASAN